ncbi:zinc/iron-chelating domain-containing protein [Methanocella sp. CWC-04]|uniref:Zinc/iron-chelating domain-containing protein n=1 Tax=Methanooceanicella nereidis TaxID=2052831 RepID=A0AAP2RD77_9EURY|nr:YkgJ family cysteine cluster protein [Methanocella sp. CWC-04]MCD1294967.1 zinc/iron-chelating domain-containing protein [Methanocella sp. CWC-04]
MSLKKKTGKCNQCGNCCRDFFIDVNLDQVTDYEFMDYIKWLSCHMNVEVKVKDHKRRKIEIQVKNPCKHLVDNGDGTYSCAIQENKPEICRHYPEEDYEDDISSKCGFKFV